MACTNAFLELLTSCGLALLGPDPRPGVLPATALNERLTILFKQQAAPAIVQPATRGLILLWHDHLDAAHTIAQGIENPDGSLVHAMMHRREPDYWNSKYWWRRVGEHPCYPKLARRVGEFLRGKGEADLATKLVPSGKWDASAFVDACEAAADQKPVSTHVQVLREIQRMEFETALAHFLDDKAH